jgi:hypothetical protein
MDCEEVELNETCLESQFSVRVSDVLIVTSDALVILLHHLWMSVLLVNEANVSDVEVSDALVISLHHLLMSVL